VTKKVNATFEGCHTTKGKLRAIAATSCLNGNYIITFSADSYPDAAEENKNLIAKALAPDHPTVLVTKNEPWAKVVLHKISRTDNNFQPCTMESLLKAVMDNPILKDIHITHLLSWVQSEEKLKDRNAASVSFTFIDNQEPILPRLLKEPFYMFGEPVRIERWQEKPRLTQCKKCW
jgi:hypothetical protein